MSRILVYGMPTVWDDHNSCSKQYICALAIYLMTVLSSLYAIVMVPAINAPGHGKNVFNGLNTTDKSYLKEQMELIVNLEGIDRSNIGILPRASKDVSFKFEYYVYSFLIIKKY